MNGAYIGIFIMLLLIIITQRRNKHMVIRKILKSKNKKENLYMVELAKRFIGKECLIYTFDQHQFTGIISEVNGSGLLIQNNGAEEAINLDYIARIREYPRNKNGKKKSVVLD